jgi:hypothetical protein
LYFKLLPRSLLRLNMVKIQLKLFKHLICFAPFQQNLT